MTRRNISTGKPSEARNAHSAGVVASGEFLFTSGITPRDADGTLIGVGDMGAQIKQTLSNVRDVLIAAGTDFDHVVKFTVFVTDLDLYLEARKAEETGHNAAMETSPASTVVEISKLAHPDMMVEIEAVALLGPSA